MQEEEAAIRSRLEVLQAALAATESRGDAAAGGKVAVDGIELSIGLARRLVGGGRTSEAVELCVCAIDLLARYGGHCGGVIMELLSLVADLYILGETRGYEGCQAPLERVRELDEDSVTLHTYLRVLQQADSLSKVIPSPKTDAVIRELAPQASEVAQRVGDAVWVAFTEYFLAQAASQGDRVGWERHLLAAAKGLAGVAPRVTESAEQRHLYGQAMMYLRQLASYYMDVSLYTDACEALEGWRDLAKLCGDRSNSFEATLGLGRIHGELFEYERAISFLEEAARLAESADDPLELAQLSLTSFEVCRRRSDHVGAGGHLGRLEVQVKRAGLVRESVPLWLALGRAFEARAEWVEAERCYQQLVLAAKALAFSDELVEGAFALGRIAYERRQWGPAVEYLTRAKELARWGYSGVRAQIDPYLEVCTRRLRGGF